MYIYIYIYIYICMYACVYYRFQLSIATSKNRLKVNTNVSVHSPALHSCDYLHKTLIKINAATDEGYFSLCTYLAFLICGH